MSQCAQSPVSLKLKKVPVRFNHISTCLKQKEIKLTNMTSVNVLQISRSSCEIFDNVLQDPEKSRNQILLVGLLIYFLMDQMKHILL